MRRITVLLMFVLIFSLVAPAFAADNVEISGEVSTIFEAAGYGDDSDTTAELWADEDAMDLGLPKWKRGKFKDGDYDDFPAVKSFYQEIGFDIVGEVSNIKFEMDIDTLINVFTKSQGVDYKGKQLGDQGESDRKVELDDALLKLEIKNVTVKLGDLDDYQADKTFLDDENINGVEVATKVGQVDLTTFMAGDGHKKDADFYGVIAEKNINDIKVTAKLLHASKYKTKKTLNPTDCKIKKTVKKTVPMTVDGKEVMVVTEETVIVDGKEVIKEEYDYDVTNFILEASKDVTDQLTVKGHLVANDWEQVERRKYTRQYEKNDKKNKDFGDPEKLSGLKDDSDIFVSLGIEFEATEKLTLDATVENAGEDFREVEGDMEEDADYNLYKLGADYKLNEKNTLKGDYTLVSTGTKGDKDKNIIELELENKTGDFTNIFGIEYTDNDDYKKNNDTRIITLGTEYPVTDNVKLSAELKNKSKDGDSGEEIRYNYLTAEVEYEIAKDIEWNTEFEFIDGEVNGKDGRGNTLNTELTVKF